MTDLEARPHPQILGLDPGFACVGWSLVEVQPTCEVVLALGVVRTQKADKKQHVLATEDNLVRAREIHCALCSLVTDKVKAFCVESMSFPRSSSVAAKMAMCWGVLAALSDSHRMPIVQTSPQKVKKALTKLAKPSKEDIQAALQARYPGLPALLTAVPRSLQEHPYDALAAAVTCLDSELIRMLRRQPS